MAMFRNNLIIFKKKVARNFRDYGLLSCLKKSALFLAKPIYEKSNVVLFKTEIKNIDGKELYQGDLDCKLVESKDTYIINQIEEMEEWLIGKLYSSLENKKLCIVALKNKKVIGFCLISLSEIYLPLLYLKVLLENDEAFSEQITVHKKYRRKGVGTQIRFMAYMELKKKGINKIYSSASINKIASIRSIEKVGGKKIGRFFYKNVFQSKQLCLLKKSGQKIFKETRGDSTLKGKLNEEYLFVTDTSNFDF